MALSISVQPGYSAWKNAPGRSAGLRAALPLQIRKRIFDLALRRFGRRAQGQPRGRELGRYGTLLKPATPNPSQCQRRHGTMGLQLDSCPSDTQAGSWSNWLKNLDGCWSA